MKAHTVNNQEIVIQANVKKAGDWDQVQKVAARMVANTDDVELVIASGCEFEQWLHLTARWDNYQASDIKKAFNAAKAV